jgi:hypothetical protein
MKTGSTNGPCILGLTLLLAGCAAGELFQVAGGTAFSFMLAPFPQTYRLRTQPMTVPAGQPAATSFPQALHGNIYVAELEGIDVLKHLGSISLDKHDADNVRVALRNSLDHAGLLNDDPKAARYQLKTTVTDNRSAGFADIVVTTRMQFSLTDVVTGETLLKESIATPGAVAMSDEPLYKDRVGKAMEGSVAGDIRALLERLRQVQIQEPAAPQASVGPDVA